jgi:hypothetical protein
MEDTYLTSCVEGKDSDWQLEEKIFVPKGSKIMIDAVGLHYNRLSFSLTRPHPAFLP